MLVNLSRLEGEDNCETDLCDAVCFGRLLVLSAVDPGPITGLYPAPVSINLLFDGVLILKCEYLMIW